MAGGQRSGGLVLVQAAAFSGEDEGAAVMDQAVGDRGGDDVVVGEGFVPFAVGAVGGDDQAAVGFVAGADEEVTEPPPHRADPDRARAPRKRRI